MRRKVNHDIFSYVNDDECYRLLDLEKEPKKVLSKLVNSYNSEKQTPLLLAIKNKNFGIAAILIENLDASIKQTGQFRWKSFQCKETLPLLAAIVSNQILIVELIVERCMKNERSSMECLSINPILSSSISRLDKINVLELTGVAYTVFAYCEDAAKPDYLAIRCWEEANKLRYLTEHNEPILPKKPIFLSDNMREAIDFEELKLPQELEFLKQELGDVRFSYQAMLVNQRSLMETSLSSFIFTHRMWFQLFRICAKNSQMKRAISAVLVIFELFEGVKRKKAEYALANQHIIMTFEELRAWMKKIFENNQELEDSFLIKLIAVVDFISRGTFTCYFIKNRKFAIDCDLEITKVWAKHIPIVDVQLSQQFKKSLRAFVRSDLRDGDHGCILHRACHSCPLPAVEVIHLLLEVGVDPNDVDRHGETPLHSLFSKQLFDPLDATICKKLISEGGNIHQVNNYNASAQDFLLKRSSELYDPALKYIAHAVPSLKSLCAQEIRNTFLYDNRKKKSVKRLPSRLQLIINPRLRKVKRRKYFKKRSLKN